MTSRQAVNADIQNALAKVGIQTAYLCRFDFKSEPVFVWTGMSAIVPSGTGDTLLDGNQFEPIINGTPYDIGSNKYSESGSDALELTLSLPADIPDELQAASIDENEYLARPATIWRGVLIQAASVTGPGIYSFRRIRTGRMDTLEFTQDQNQNVVKLTIEAWASYISDANQSTYADQHRFDPNDTSQNFLSSTTTASPIANRQSYKASGSSAGAYGSGAGGGHGAFGGLLKNF